MGLTDNIKKEAVRTQSKVQTSEEREIEQLLNRLFYAPKRIQEEAEFVKQVMTRGQETDERKGLHASNVTASGKKYCLRESVLSLFYKQRQSDESHVPVGLKRIFMEGDCIHEKWQRLFIRGGYATKEDMDVPTKNEEYELEYTPDIKNARIPELWGGEPFVVEIKSVNTFQFQKMVAHPGADKQIMLYEYMERCPRGIVLCEDKNTQDIRVFVRMFDKEKVRKYVMRLREIQEAKQVFLTKQMPPERHGECVSPMCERAAECNMRDACYNVGMGRVRLDVW